MSLASDKSELNIFSHRVNAAQMNNIPQRYFSCAQKTAFGELQGYHFVILGFMPRIQLTA
jgi:hypothetical protein